MQGRQLFSLGVLVAFNQGMQRLGRCDHQHHVSSCSPGSHKGVKRDRGRARRQIGRTGAAGADAFLLKDCPAQDLLDVIASHAQDARVHRVHQNIQLGSYIVK